jgi:thiol:disulfide interchange protein DsbC
MEAKEILKDIVDEVHAVELSVVPGLYIIEATGKNGKRGIIYMDFGKNHIISGSFMSIADRKNVTKSEMLQLHRADIAAIPLTDSIVIGDPKAPTKMILFTDPQCPFCRKFHPELKKVVKADPDVAIFIKMLPLASLHPDSPRIASAILCSESLQLLEDSFAGKKIPDPTCKSDAVDRTIKLAEELGIGSTPTLILPDGRIAPGYRDAEEILELLKEGK